MSFDYNELNREYQFVAGTTEPGFGMLAPFPKGLFKILQEQQSLEYRSAVPMRQRQLLSRSGCLTRLDGFLFQLSKVSGHANALRSGTPVPAGVPKPEGESMLVVSAAEACYDFEGLLLQARAALDRLTAFVASEHGQRCNRFSRIRGLLGNFAAKDRRASEMLDLLRKAPVLDGILLDAAGEKALRSVVAHYSSVIEGRQIAFTIHFRADGRRLIFDCEAVGRPLFGTSESLAVAIPFLVLNTLAIYSDVPTIPQELFAPVWQNPSVSFTSYQHDGPGSIRFTVANMLPDGFAVMTKSLRPEVLDRTVE